MATESQINANRANALLSTGPSTPEGKFKSSHNALKTGLTGITVVLPTDDTAAYQKLVDAINTKFQPETDAEKLIVQSIADTEWRLLRVPRLEAGFYAGGRAELAGEYAAEPDPQVRAAMIEALVLRTYQKDFNNLALQERRLRNQLKELTVALSQLQADRDAVHFHRRNNEMTNKSCFNYTPRPDAPAYFGFEFTGEYLDTRKVAFRHGGDPALLQFDRSWRSQIAPKPS